MPSCPRCEAEYPNGATKCDRCGAPLDGSDPSASGEAGSVVAPEQVLVRPTLQALVKRYGVMVAAGLLVVLVYAELADYLWRQWHLSYSYYSHGPLVPLIAIFMVWANRKKMAGIKIRSSWLGLLLIVPCIPVFAFGRWTGSMALVSGTMLPMIVGVVLMLTGPKMTRLLLFPILFLFFMIPLPATILDSMTFKVQFQSTTFAAKIPGLTYSVEQVGTQINSTDLPEPLVVGAPCSGFRLLISLLTFTAFFVYMVQTKPWKKALLVVSAFPLSLFINSLRIAMIGYAGFWTGSADAMHEFHDWSGYLGLVICFVILFGFARLIGADKFGIPDPGLLPDVEPAPSSYGGARRVAAVGVLALLVASNALLQPLSATAKGKLDRSAIPAAFGAWSSNQVPVEKMVTDMLKTGDMTQRVYVNRDDGRQIVVFVEAAKDADAYHDPHACLPGGGSPVTQDRPLDIVITEPRPMTIHATVLQATGEYGTALVVYWYMNKSATCPTTPAMRQRMRLMQLQNFTRVALHPGQADAVEREIDRNQWHWYRFSTEVWQDPETDLKVMKEFISEFVSGVKDFGE